MRSCADVGSIFCCGSCGRPRSASLTQSPAVRQPHSPDSPHRAGPSHLSPPPSLCVSLALAQVVPAWDAAFVDLEQETLFELILAANYMDIKPLLDLTCAKVASMIKGKTPEQIRKAFNIVNDFTPEEEQKVREENKWCEES